MFDNLSDKLDKAFHILKGHGKITEINVAETLKEVRRYSDQSVKEVTQELVKNQKETTAEIRALRNEVDMKIKKALDNPLSQ